MVYSFPDGDPRSGRRQSTSYSTRMKRPPDARAQPAPSNPGITKQMVRQHAHRLFRDKWPRQPLTLREWRLAEQDLVRTLEAEAF
jgi:hypothetical protein